MHCPWTRKSRAWGYEVIRGIDEDDQNRIIQAFKHPTELKVVDVNSQVEQDYGGYAWTEWIHQYYGDTALHLAIKWKRHRAVKALLSLKADWTIPNEAGHTAATLAFALYGKDMATLKLEQEREYEAEQMRIEEETMLRFMEAEVRAHERARQGRLDEIHAMRMLGVRNEAWILLEHGRVLAGESVADREQRAASRRWVSHVCDQLRRNRSSVRRADIRRKKSPARAPASRSLSPTSTPPKRGPSSAASDTHDGCSIPVRRPGSEGRYPKRSTGRKYRLSGMMSPPSEGRRTPLSAWSEGRSPIRPEGSPATDSDLFPAKAPSQPQAEVGQMGSSSVGSFRIVISPSRTTNTLTKNRSPFPVRGASVKRSSPMARLRRKMQTVKRARLAALGASRQQPQPRPCFPRPPVVLDATTAATAMVIGEDSRRSIHRGEQALSSYQYHAADAPAESRSECFQSDTGADDNAEQVTDTVNNQLRVNEVIAEGYTDKYDDGFAMPMADNTLQRSLSPGGSANDVHPSGATGEPYRSLPVSPGMAWGSNTGDAPSLSLGPMVSPSASFFPFGSPPTRGGECSVLDSPARMIAPGKPKKAFVTGRGRSERMDDTERVQSNSSPVFSPSLQNATVKEVLGELKEGPLKDKLTLLLASDIDGRGKRHFLHWTKISRHHGLKYCGPMGSPEAGALAGVLAFRLGALVHLNLCGARLGDQGVAQLAPALPWIRHVDLRSNNIGDVGVMSVASAIRTASAAELNSLNLNAEKSREQSRRPCHTEDRQFTVLEGIPCTLKSLSLAGNRMGDLGCDTLGTKLFFGELGGYCPATFRWLSIVGNVSVSDSSGDRLIRAGLDHGPHPVAVVV